VSPPVPSARGDHLVTPAMPPATHPTNYVTTSNPPTQHNHSTTSPPPSSRNAISMHAANATPQLHSISLNALSKPITPACTRSHTPTQTRQSSHTPSATPLKRHGHTTSNGLPTSPSNHHPSLATYGADYAPKLNKNTSPPYTTYTNGSCSPPHHRTSRLPNLG
jgi:hypothetical protein